MNLEAQSIITRLDLQKHPEGGFFKEVYRSKESIPNSVLGTSFEGDRNYCTSIYFLLTSENFSAFHKINQDEIWHFYKGTCLHLHIITKDGTYHKVLIGNDLENGEVPQYVVKAGDWFAAEIPKDNSFAFVGCTVAPGFDFKDFVMPNRDELIAEFPNHKEIITQLTHE